jgi:hypothetical protein
MHTRTSILGVAIAVAALAWTAPVSAASSDASTVAKPSGEMIRNGSFEETRSPDDWRSFVVPAGIRSPTKITGESRFVFGEESWDDIEFSFTFNPRKPADDERPSVLIGFRYGGNRHYTAALAVSPNQGHILERTVYDPRTERSETTVLESVPGSVPVTQWWCRVRVRCEGPRIRLWLDKKYLPDLFPEKDETLLFDVVDRDGPTTGKINVGVRGGQASFWDLKVTSLDGKVLFEGGPARAQHWYAIGNSIGDVWLAEDRPLHGKRSLAIVTDYGDVGVAQKHLRLRKGTTYRGSLWMRGDWGNIIVRLVDGETVLAEQESGYVEEWKEFPLELTPNADANDATLQILNGDGAFVCLDRISLAPDSARQEAGPQTDSP